MTTQIVEYSQTEAGLSDIRQRLANVVFDVATPAGMEEARKARRELVTLRVALEEKRVELKAPALERSRLIDAEAKRINGEIRAVEDPIDQQVKAEEQRKQAEKDERERVERNRIVEIRGRIDQMARLPLLLTGAAATKLKDARAKLADIVPIAELYAEFLDEALQVRAGVLEQLDAAIPKQEAQEAEQSRLKAEREELDRQKAEQARIETEQRARAAEEDRQRRARLDEDEREAREKREREERQAQTRRDEADRVAREARQRADQEAAVARAAAQKKIDDEAADLRRKQREKEEREAEEAAEREVAARTAAEKTPSDPMLALIAIAQVLESPLYQPEMKVRLAWPIVKRTLEAAPKPRRAKAAPATAADVKGILS